MTVIEIENLGEFIDFIKNEQDDNTKSKIFKEQILAF